MPSCVSLSSLSHTGTARPLAEGDRRGTHFLASWVEFEKQVRLKREAA